MSRRPIIIDPPTRYIIRVDHGDGTPPSIVDHKSRTEFSRRVAIRYAREIQNGWAHDCQIYVLNAENK